MTQQRRGSVAEMIEGKRRKKDAEQEAEDTCLVNSEDVQRLVARNISDEELERVRTQRIGTTFAVDAHRYHVQSVYRDKLGRILEVGTRVSTT